MNDLSLVIDPGGIPGVRLGINLRVYPSGDSIGEFQSIGTQAERLQSGLLTSGGFKNLYEFTTTFSLDGPDFDKFHSLMLWNQNERENGRPWEVVVYNLVRPFSEIRATRSRFKVPGTDVISSSSFGGGLTSYVYWVAIQGAMNATWVQTGSRFQINMAFSEGTFLSAADEP